MRTILQYLGYTTAGLIAIEFVVCVVCIAVDWWINRNDDGRRAESDDD